LIADVRLPCRQHPNPIPAHRHTIERYRNEVAFIRSLQPQW
jgi:hypothetical protein